MRRIVLLPVVTVLAAVALTACGSSSDEESPEAVVEPNGESVTVRAVDNVFDPEETTISAGTEIVWENRGRNEHNVIPEDPEAEWRAEAEDFQPGDSTSFVFTEPGTYRYYCSIHGTIDVGMPGVIVVE